MEEWSRPYQGLGAAPRNPNWKIHGVQRRYRYRNLELQRLIEPGPRSTPIQRQCGQPDDVRKKCQLDLCAIELNIPFEGDETVDLRHLGLHGQAEAAAGELVFHV